MITKDKKTMISDSYVLWRITDPLKFAQTLNSSLENSESRINTAVYNATKKCDQQSFPGQSDHKPGRRIIGYGDGSHWR